MIRPTVPGDTPAIVALTDETSVFKPLEIVALREVLDDYHSANHDLGHKCVSYERDGSVIAYAYYAPAAMTDRTWYLYWIAVQKQTQAAGIGSELLGFLERDIRANRGRILLIETSSLSHYEPTRRFYFKHGYEHHATLRDYYAEGDDMVVFRKRMPPDVASA